MAPEHEQTHHHRKPVVTPIVQSATFAAETVDAFIGTEHGDTAYTRQGNPTMTAVEDVLADLENAEAALVFGSGMAAITSTLLALVRSGDHIVAQQQLFYQTSVFLQRWAGRYGINVSLVDAVDERAFAAAIRPNTRLIFVESPTNPGLKIVALQAIAAIARSVGVLTVIDSTFGTPINQRPIEAGFDLVVHSATKYLAGHADLVCGAVAGRRALIEEVRHARTTFGGVMDPHAAWLLLRGVKTLAVRVARQNENALQLALFLAAHPSVAVVHYPFLESHPQYRLAQSQMAGGGGVISFELRNGAAAARSFIESLSLIRHAGSLGGVESLASLPALTFGPTLSPLEREQMDVRDDLVRLAVGIEDAYLLEEDLQRALEAQQR